MGMQKVSKRGLASGKLPMPARWPGHVAGRLDGEPALSGRPSTS